MSDPANDDLSARLRKLPGQLLLALVNGTAVLVILAAILAIIATSKVTHLAHDVASTMTDAVLSRVGEDPRHVVQNIQRVADDVHTLTVALETAKTEGVPGLAPEVARLNERLDELQSNLQRLRAARSNLIDELVARVGNAANNALQNLGTCPCPHEKDADIGPGAPAASALLQRPGFESGSDTVSRPKSPSRRCSTPNSCNHISCSLTGDFPIAKS